MSSGGSRSRPGEVVVRDAATVMLVRDGHAGMEVFMLRRNLKSDFVGGAYVFPGGAVDEADKDAEEICPGRDDMEASALLQIESGGLAYWVAAIRECFEEAGVLLAYRPDGEILSLADPGTAARFVEHRHAVNSGTGRLVDICRRENLMLAVERIHYFAHWITPVGAPRRYDTRFFVTAAPPEQVPLHDNAETIAHVWIRPADALARHEQGEFDLIFPTIRNLVAISRFDTSAELLAAAAAIESVPAVLPRLVADGNGLRLVLPGDPGYDDITAAPPEGISFPTGPSWPSRD